MGKATLLSYKASAKSEMFLPPTCLGSSASPTSAPESQEEETAIPLSKNQLGALSYGRQL